MIQGFEYFTANPGGNITGFVVWPVYPGFRKAYQDAIKEQISPEVEQIGFISPSYDGPPLRLDMTGGEFCANATRAYGLYAAGFLKEKGKFNMEVYVSGIDHPINVVADTEENTAYVELEAPKAVHEIEVDGKTYKAYELQGITHLIVDDIEENEEFVGKALAALKSEIDAKAYGVMFYDEKNSTMIPYVNVVGPDTLVRESSCGSGTAALGYFLNQTGDEEFKKTIKEANGELELIVEKDDEGKTRVLIGGPVEFSETKRVKIDIPSEIEKEVKEEYLKTAKDSEEEDLF
jgi:diaminopimelate epimerase